LISFEKMVLPERLELSTSPLPRECSTTELRQRALPVAHRLSGIPKRSGGAGRVIPDHVAIASAIWTRACRAITSGG
jgi:hypothetical protein